MSAADCPGTWGSPREIGSDSGITVQRCSGCADLLVIYRYHSVAVPPGSDDAEIARRVWESVGRSVETHPVFEALSTRAKATIIENWRDGLDAQRDPQGNIARMSGCDVCYCGCKYWERDQCVDCGGTEVAR